MRYMTLVLALVLFPLLASAQTQPSAVPVKPANSTVPAPGLAPAPTAGVQGLYDQVRKSLVAVQYTWDSELGRRDVIGAGVVVSEDGLVMTTLSLMDPRIPDQQMKDFKLLVASDTSDADEIDAQFLGRDERGEVAFVKAKPKVGQKWQALKFVAHSTEVGEPLWSVGLLPKIAGYKAYIVESRVAAKLRGELPQVLASGPLAAIGSPVLDSQGNAVGFVNAQPEQPIILNEPKLGLSAVSRPPVFFIASEPLLASIADPPAGEPLKLPWIGVMQLVGLKKDVAEYFGLGDQPAVQIGDIIPGGPAAKAGLKPGQIILKLNGKTLERGDSAEELPSILRRQLMWMKVGSPVMLTLVDPRTRKTQDVRVTLEERPKPANLAGRYFAEDLGFAVREMVFMDLYSRRLPPEGAGVVVAMIRPQSAAQNARLEANDLVVDLNGKTIKNLDQFEKEYQTFRKEHAKEAVVMVILREGRNQTIRIEPPQ
jgi:serine protease Do